MNYKKLGNTDLDVSTICLGTMTWGEQNTQEEGFEQMDYALDKGVNFWDTAELYAVPPKAETFGHTEVIIGNWFRKTKKRDKIILATKVAGPSREYLRGGGYNYGIDKMSEAINDSLKRLQTDHLDMYGLHNPKLEHIRNNSIFDVLDSFVEDESINTYQIALGPAIGWTQEGVEAMERPNVSAVQTVYNILEQTPGNELMKKAEEKQVGILVRVPEASGILTGKVNAETKIDEKDHRSVRKGEWVKASLAKVEVLKPIAERNDLTITELSMKFIMSKKGFASVFPTVVSEEEIVNYVEMTKGGYISASDMKEIEELYNTWPSYELKATPQTK